MLTLKNQTIIRNKIHQHRVTRIGSNDKGLKSARNVQSVSEKCVLNLFLPFLSLNRNRNSMAVTSIFLSISVYSIQLELWILQSVLTVNGNIYFYWNYSECPNKQRQSELFLKLYIVFRNFFWLKDS